jgi:phosphoribosylformylglycinamidine cyclo-ligase
MPGVYAPGDFDMAGFCVGVVEKTRLIDGSAIRPGDKLIGLGSSGFHANGYSLVRKVVFEQCALSLEHTVPELGRTVADLLMEPTRIYVRPVLEALASGRGKGPIHGMAHITGGGLVDNVERILPENCRAVIDASSWEPPPVFAWFQSLGQVDRNEMLRTFNMGVGFVLIVSPRSVRSLSEQLAASGLPCWTIGTIREGTSGVELAG